MSDPRKAVFDAIRAVQPVMAAHVPIIDKALDDIGFPRAGVASEGWKPAAIKIMHEFEGFHRALSDGRVQAYPDPATGGKPWTIGYGSTTDEHGNPIAPGTIWTRQRAEARFAQDVDRFAGDVRKLIGEARTTDNQFAAMVSLAYNIGTGNFGKSTLLKKHKAGAYAGAKAEFLKWNKAAGKVMAGLTRRRAAEAALYGS